MKGHQDISKVQMLIICNVSAFLLQKQKSCYLGFPAEDHLSRVSRRIFSLTTALNGESSLPPPCSSTHSLIIYLQHSMGHIFKPLCRILARRLPLCLMGIQWTEFCMGLSKCTPKTLNNALVEH